MRTSFQVNVAVRCKEVLYYILVHDGTAEPLRVSPPEAVGLLLELNSFPFVVLVNFSGFLFNDERSASRYCHWPRPTPGWQRCHDHRFLRQARHSTHCDTGGFCCTRAAR